ICIRDCLFSSHTDIEAAALLCATIAWGKRSMICRNCQRMLDIMDNRPTDYILSGEFETLADEKNIHRTFFNANFKHWLRGLQRIFKTYGSVEGLVKSKDIANSKAPAWELAAALNAELAAANDGCADSRCLPLNLQNTALKRLNMALRWLVRRDGIVDLGIWDSVKPSQLYIPLDVHVGNTARGLGLLDRRSNDRRAVEELTATLRDLRPDDPTFYDFALFGIGVTGKL
ncbi:MAG: TIGR02757 family protein, partial [Muribaculaceae bacterium]|nr:TIGR02757 family protein [Muribaculaceae bacterium]